MKEIGETKMSRLAGKTAIVTGASKGIGAGLQRASPLKALASSSTTLRAAKVQIASFRKSKKTAAKPSPYKPTFQNTMGSSDFSENQGKRLEHWTSLLTMPAFLSLRHFRKSAKLSFIASSTSTSWVQFSPSENRSIISRPRVEASSISAQL